MRKFLIALLFVLHGIPAFASERTDSLMNVLKTEISRKKQFDNQKELRIKQLQLQLLSAIGYDRYIEYAIYDQLYQEYKSYNFDSAYTCAQKLLAISKIKNDMPKQQESLIKTGFLFISAGMFKEGFDCLNKIKSVYLNDSTKVEYYTLLSRAYGNLAEYNNDKYFTTNYLTLSGKYLDSAIILCKPKSYNWMMLHANKQILVGDTNKPWPYLTQLLGHYPLDEHQRAIAAYGLSFFYTSQKNKQKYIELLAISAINEIRSSTKETLAIFMLGQQIYQNGDEKNAYLFIQQAMSDAQFYGANLRKIKIGAVLSVIASRKIIAAENNRNSFIVCFLSVAAVTILISLVSYIVFIQLKSLKVKEKIIEENNAQLEVINKKFNENGRINEQYIGHFMNVTSSYILLFEKLKRSIERKIKTKRYDDILLSFNDIDIKKEREKLFHTFDHAFLRIFPNFIFVFNSMLRKEDQIWPKDNADMNTELRIFALMRLGIGDCETIANILEYTGNTIYVYKMRIKAKSIIQGDKFEKVLMAIKAVPYDEPLPYRKSA